MPLALARASFSARELVAAHPPRIRDDNKALIHALACPDGPSEGLIEASRWKALPLPSAIPTRPVTFTGRPSRFDYAAAEEGTVAWHVNFADQELFFAYGSGLFAQDEMQCAEHPILGSLREALIAAPIPGFPALTTEQNEATPVLVMGAARACAISTEVGSESIYGSAMRRASKDTIRKAVRRLDPPTITHVLAIEAIPGGRGRYTMDQIRRTVVTATTGFAAARLESHRVSATSRVVVHSGHWGCGAFGGNRRLMAPLQILSAQLAGLDELVFHAFDPAGLLAFEGALKIFHTQLMTGAPLDEVLQNVEALGYEWGNSDGN